MMTLVNIKPDKHQHCAHVRMLSLAFSLTVELLFLDLFLGDTILRNIYCCSRLKHVEDAISTLYAHGVTGMLSDFFVDPCLTLSVAIGLTINASAVMKMFVYPSQKTKKYLPYQVYLNCCIVNSLETQIYR